jgi:hypothetical protein
MGDENETAFGIVARATGADQATGPEVLAELIADLREGIGDGADDNTLALRVWPRLVRLAALATAEKSAELQEGLRRWQEARHESAAVELGRKGGRKGGKARAMKLSPDERSEIARVAAQARWKKARENDES